MGLFFKQGSVPPDRAVSVVEDALKTDPPTDAATARVMATQAVNDNADAAGPRLAAFGGAATVFLVLLVAAFLAAQAADSQTAETSYMQDLAGLLQTLLTAWSAAVVGLIGGEALGKAGS